MACKHPSHSVQGRPRISAFLAINLLEHLHFVTRSLGEIWGLVAWPAEDGKTQTWQHSWLGPPWKVRYLRSHTWTHSYNSKMVTSMELWDRAPACYIIISGSTDNEQTSFSTVRLLCLAIGNHKNAEKINTEKLNIIQKIYISIKQIDSYTDQFPLNINYKQNSIKWQQVLHLFSL